MAVTPVALTTDELRIWEAEWVELTSSFTREQQGERIRAIFERNREFVRGAAGIAKAEFRGAGFGGVDAQGGFGWQILRPEHLRHTTTDGDTVDIDWKRTVAAVGWNFFIGTTTVFNQISRRALVVLLGIANHDPSPKSLAMQLLISGITYPVYDLYMQLKYEGAVRSWAFPKPKLIPPLEQLKIQFQDKATGSDEPQILGITYAESGYLQTLVPDLESP